MNEFYAETMTSGCKFYWEDGIGFCGEEHILWRLLTEIDIVQAIFCGAARYSGAVDERIASTKKVIDHIRNG